MAFSNLNFARLSSGLEGASDRSAQRDRSIDTCMHEYAGGGHNFSAHSVVHH